jgi:hypothetical protein
MGKNIKTKFFKHWKNVKQNQRIEHKVKIMLNQKCSASFSKFALFWKSSKILPKKLVNKKLCREKCRVTKYKMYFKTRLKKWIDKEMKVLLLGGWQNWWWMYCIPQSKIATLKGFIYSDNKTKNALTKKIVIHNDNKNKN